MFKKTCLFAVALLATLSLWASARLPRIFADNMVLQRDKPIAVWGWADAGEEISVFFDNQVKKVTADQQGHWQTSLDPHPAGGPYQLVVKGKDLNRNVSISNVLVGEVWICSGQSNMEMPLAGWKVNNYKQEIASADYSQIRFFMVGRAISTVPSDTLPAGEHWKICNKDNAGPFSAVAYFFARDLYRQLHVPIGLIGSFWGGSMIETWTSRDAFEKSGEFKDMIGGLPSGPDFTALLEKSRKAPTDQISPNSAPTLLFNTMINPLIPYTIRGVIWYQGESNAGRAYQYRKAFPLMITDWRTRWGLGDFPFYFVQLSSFGANNEEGKGSSWAELREAQAMTLSLPNTGMAVTTDIGNAKDIHPVDKEDVGQRLAAIALNNLYGQKREYSGPVYQSMQKEGNKIILTFTHIGGGLTVHNQGDSLKGFTIAGDDHQFHYAQAKIEGNKVIVWLDGVTAPVALRYNWSDDAGSGNLFNKDGFPAPPFRTDQWKGITEDVKYVVGK
jgi:sialate O-acetylesterase